MLNIPLVKDTLLLIPFTLNTLIPFFLPYLLRLKLLCLSVKCDKIVQPQLLLSVIWWKQKTALVLGHVIHHIQRHVASGFCVMCIQSQIDYNR